VDVAQGEGGALARRQAVEEREAPGDRLRIGSRRARRIVAGALGRAAPARPARLAQRDAARRRGRRDRATIRRGGRR
jgi:hypothetical protein